MSLETVLPLIREYHSGQRRGAAQFFAERPDMLAWARAEIDRLAVPVKRGVPPQDDRVSIVHREALKRMVAEYEGTK